MPRDDAAVWSRHAAQWARVGAPLRPCAEDARLLTRLAADTNGGPCLVLGVTPEIVQLPWLAARPLLAVDHNEAMVRALWDPTTAAARAGRHRSLIAHWQQLPLPAGQSALALGDGSLSALPSLDACRDVLRELHRVLSPGGAAVLRCFERPPDAAALAEQLPAWVDRGEFGSFEVLKWRLAMALADPLDGSVAVSAVAAAFDQLFPDRDALASRTGWPRERIDTIDAYRQSTTRYHFASLAQLADAAAPGFLLEAVERPGYELGAQCPTVRLRRRDGPWSARPA